MRQSAAGADAERRERGQGMFRSAVRSDMREKELKKQKLGDWKRKLKRERGTKELLVSREKRASSERGCVTLGDGEASWPPGWP